MTETIEEQIKRLEAEIQRLRHEIAVIARVVKPPVKRRRLDEPWVPEVRG